MPADPAVLKLRLDRLMERRHAAEFDLHLDVLTGLPNRRAFGRRLRRALDELLPGDHKALVLIDLDGFKRINHEIGHAVGDRILRAVADRLGAALGPEDAIARLGGDEFALILSRFDAATLVRDAERLLHAVSQPLGAEGDAAISLTASAGMAALRPGVTVPEILRRADAAVHEAKAQGRSRLAHFEPIDDGQGTGLDECDEGELTAPCPAAPPPAPAP